MSFFIGSQEKAWVTADLALLIQQKFLYLASISDLMSFDKRFSFSI
jgi:hypothetical protein